jgi:probable DNA metabolism protein
MELPDQTDIPGAAAAVAAGRAVAARSFAEWRAAARDLLAYDIAPDAVRWANRDGDGRFSGAPPGPVHTDNASCTLDNPRPPLRLRRTLVDLLQTAACYRVAGRWAFLYRVVWRWQHGEHGVLSAADEDGARLHAMVEAVQREEHDMHAHIRFRERPEQAGPPRFVAWFEPAHDVLPQVAQHFVSRMRGVSWMIATPEASVLWDGASLHDTGAPLRSAGGRDGNGEAPWLAYYRDGSDPARLDRRAMRSHGRLQAQTLGDAPSTLDQCRRCDLWRNATQAVGGAGPKRARIMLVGEQPGDQEDLAGAPFVGPAGKLLDRALAQAELDRRKVYLTNAVKHFKWEPRGKRRMHKTPAQREIEACGYWLEKELAQVRPEVVVALGSTALKAVLGTSHATLKDTIGRPIRHDGRWVVTIYHPSYVLRVPDAAAKEQAFGVMVEGLRLAQRLLGSSGSPPP